MATVDIVGVIEDGTPIKLRSTGAPVNPRTTLELQQGATLLVRFRLVYASGKPVELNLSAGHDVVTLTVKKTPDNQAVLSKVAVAPAQLVPGRCNVQIDPSDLLPQRVPWGRYTWDLTLKRASGVTEKPVPLSPCSVLASDK